MKIVTVITKILVALAAVCGAVYALATYGDQIVAWAKKVLASLPKCDGECQCECECDGECDTCECECKCEEAEVTEEPIEEEPAAEEAEEAPAEEVVIEEGEVVADDADFEG